jgi:TatA/E family protein of Tat protein translocase
MGIGNIGWSEFIVILAIALIFFGPRRLPSIAQAIGKSLREFQKALNEVKSEIAQAGREADVRTGPPHAPRDPLSLQPGPSETIARNGGLAVEADTPPHARPDPEPGEAASGLAGEVEVTMTPRLSRRDSAGGERSQQDEEIDEGSDHGDARDTD